MVKYLCIGKTKFLSWKKNSSNFYQYCKLALKKMKIVILSVYSLSFDANSPKKLKFRGNNPAKYPIMNKFHPFVF